jgi:hypothetical protein
VVINFRVAIVELIPRWWSENLIVASPVQAQDKPRPFFDFSVGNCGQFLQAADGERKAKPPNPQPHSVYTRNYESIPAKGADQPFDWDRYHAEQDACLEADRIAQDCTKGVAFCDELALRQAKRACSAFGPLGDERRP